MESYFITYKSSQIHYYQYGTGNKLLLCFHGYGESGASFGFLEKYIAGDFTAIALDFPLHGQTIWSEGMNFDASDLLVIIDKIINSKSIPKQKKCLLGFSMGGRVALALMEHITEDIEKIILVAPDGLTISFWYWLATQTILGNRLFYLTMQYPGWFFFLLKIGNMLRIINQSVFKFASHYLHNKPIRTILYNRWTLMRKFRPNSKKIKQLVIHNQIPTKLLYGEFDRIIRYQVAEQFRIGIESLCTLDIIHSGHQLLLEKNAAHILSLLKKDQC
jgi:pimeloyl-ACP methyl ester carboxylesterase